MFIYLYIYMTFINITSIHLSNCCCIKDLLKIKRINKNMKKYIDIQMHFFENVLVEISNKKSQSHQFNINIQYLLNSRNTVFH